MGHRLSSACRARVVANFSAQARWPVLASTDENQGFRAGKGQSGQQGGRKACGEHGGRPAGPPGELCSTYPDLRLAALDCALAGSRRLCSRRRSPTRRREMRLCRGQRRARAPRATRAPRESGGGQVHPSDLSTILFPPVNIRQLLSLQTYKYTCKTLKNAQNAPAAPPVARGAGAGSTPRFHTDRTARAAPPAAARRTPARKRPGTYSPGAAFTPP